MLKIARILIVAALVSQPVVAQQKDLLGWDLSYKSVLERNSVALSEWIWPWLKRYKSPAENWIANWRGTPIVSSILIEYPAFHAAEHQTMWFVRTADEAHYWELIEGHEKDQNEEPVKPEVYDALFRQVSSWPQLKPKPPKETHKDELPGNIGFLSTYGKEGSRQVLLTMEDFVICVDVKKGCEPGPERLKEGRLMAALEPIFFPHDVKNYKHKSETEIAGMTPEQRIDEEIKEGDHRSVSDNHGFLIQKYRRKDGLKAWSRLIELINEYYPKRVRDTRFFRAMMIAEEIDRRVVRLRGSREGLQVIEAIERLSTRMCAAGKDDESVKMTFESVKGLNDADRAIQDTLWVKYRIKISDSELLEFSNYLVRSAPTYPSWSETEWIKDNSRTNEAGVPLQISILKKPDPYYQQYLAFKCKVR